MNPLPPTDAAPLGDASLTPGRRLRAAREARGLQLDALALLLKVPTRQLEALEHDRYEAFSGPTFVRATAQTLCRHLGIDPAPVLAGLPQAASALSVRPSATVPLSPQALPRRASRRMGLSRRVIWLAALMLLVSAVLIWWPDAGTDPVTPAATTPAAEEFLAPASAMASEPAAMANGGAALPSSSALASAPTSAPTWVPSTPAAPAVSPGALPATLAPAPAVPATVSASSAVAPAAQPAAGLRIAASGETWLEVRDARGQLLVNRLLLAGEVQQVDAPAPLQVVIGRAAMAQVSRAGQPFDLSPHTKGSIARFEVLP